MSIHADNVACSLTLLQLLSCIIFFIMHRSNIIVIIILDAKFQKNFKAVTFPLLCFSCRLLYAVHCNLCYGLYTFHVSL